MNEEIEFEQFLKRPRMIVSFALEEQAADQGYLTCTFIYTT